MKLNNKGVVIDLLAVAIVASLMIGMFKTAHHVDHKVNKQKYLAKDLKIAPADKYSGETLYER